MGGKPADLIRDLEPVLKDPEVREVFRDQIDRAIADHQRATAGRNEADPELDDLLAARSALQKRTAPELAPGHKEPIGGTRGPDVYQHDPKKTIGPKDLDAQVKRLEGGEGWAIEGTRFTRVGENRYVIDVPQAGRGAARVEVETISVRAGKLAVSQHGAEGGPARIELTPPTKPGGPWSAKVYIDHTVMKDNIRFVVGHELDEVAGIVHHRPTATKGEIAAEMAAGIFTAKPMPGTPHITAHDRATAFELYELHLSQQEATVALGRARRGGNLDEIGAIEAQIRRRQESIDRLVHWMALDDPSNIDLKVRALRGAGKGDAWDTVVPGVQREGADAFVGRFYAARGGVPPPESPITTSLVSHLRYPNPQAEDPRGPQAPSRSWASTVATTMRCCGHSSPTTRSTATPSSRWPHQRAQARSRTALTTSIFGPERARCPAGRPRLPAGRKAAAGGLGGSGETEDHGRQHGRVPQRGQGGMAVWRTANPGMANPPDGKLALVSPFGARLLRGCAGGGVNVYASRDWAAP